MNLSLSYLVTLKKKKKEPERIAQELVAQFSRKRKSTQPCRPGTVISLSLQICFFLFFVLLFFLHNAITLCVEKHRAPRKKVGTAKENPKQPGAEPLVS